MQVLVTGGAGFIGTAVTLRMMAEGHAVTVIDSLIRPGNERNLATIDRASQSCRGRFRFVSGDVADAAVVQPLVRAADVVIHLAAQVSVVGALADPVLDFRSNAIGTFNILDAARLAADSPIVLVASTNKVYGPLDRLHALELPTRWCLPDRPIGIAESEPLNLCTPYACSKGAADCYTLDFARSFGVRAVVFRQSCIYGINQQATEEQAWAAWLIKAALSGQRISIFGDGKQVRDLLYVDDLVDAYWRAIDRIDDVAGLAFNIGGGPGLTLSIWQEYSDLVQELLGRRIEVNYAPARTGDQRVFISDITRAAAQLGWAPKTSIRDGVSEMFAWMRYDFAARA